VGGGDGGGGGGDSWDDSPILQRKVNLNWGPKAGGRDTVKGIQVAKSGGGGD